MRELQSRQGDKSWAFCIHLKQDKLYRGSLDHLVDCTAAVDHMCAGVYIYMCACVEPAAGLGLAIANLASDYHLKITFCVMRTRQKCSKTLHADAEADLYTRHEQVTYIYTQIP